jgi:CHASE3 domain sensor protein
LIDGIYKKQNQRYIKKINRLGALKKENEAYKEMWKDLDNFINIFHKETTGPILRDIRDILIKLKEEYLGGGK